MTTKVVNGIYTATYDLLRPVTTLSITASGYLAGGVMAAGTGAYTLINSGGILGDGFGVSLAGGGVVKNNGMIDATSTTTGAGIILGHGGTVANGGAGAPQALISGLYGVEIMQGAGTVTNGGTIVGTSKYGILLQTGGAVTNGGVGANRALIEGQNAIVMGIAGAVLNYGTVAGTGPAATGVYLLGGGAVTNAAGATIESGGLTVRVLQTGTVTNQGDIRSTGTAGAGVVLEGGGLVTNGDAGNTSALIEGAYGVEFALQAGTLNNFGTIKGDATNFAVALDAGGVVTNDAGGQLQGGQSGVFARNISATVANFGTIAGGSAGVALTAGGYLANGSVKETGAVMQGRFFGAEIIGGAGTVSNLGTIRGAVVKGAGGVFAGGVYLTSGSLTNGAVGDSTALIEGFYGVKAGGGVTVTNNGVISGSHSSKSTLPSVGVALGGGVMTNTAGALVIGFYGVVVGVGGSLTNFGTIAGTGGTAVILNDPADVLNAEGGSSISGVVMVGGGTVAVASGTATMTGLSTGGSVVGAGTLSLQGGASTFNPGASLQVARVIVSGAATTVTVGLNLADAKIWTQSAGTLSVNGGFTMTFSGTGNSFAGTLAGAGAVALAGGSDAFSGLTLAAANQSISNAAVTLSGAITLGANLSVTTPNLIVAAGGATIGGTGQLRLSNLGTNSIHGATPSATLTDNGKIVGAGSIGGGSMILVIGAAGFVDGNNTVALTIDTGANTIANGGIIYAIGTGGVMVKSAINNTGKLYADGGVLTLNAAVTGAGIGEINGGTLFAASTFTENVALLGTKGVLELAHSQTYTGSISGFSKTGGTQIDLNDIAFGANTNATFSGTATSGVLAVTDGTHTAHITLIGDYRTSTFTASSDGHGGTTVVDPTKGGGAAVMLAPTHAFITAMAGLGAGSAMTAIYTAAPWRAPAAMLAGPRTVVA